MEDPVVPLERNLYGHPLAGLLWERQFEKILLKHGWEKIPNWECLFVHREKGLFLSVYVDDIKLAGKKQNLDPMSKVLNKEVGCTQRQCEKKQKKLWTITEPCSNREFPWSEQKSFHTLRFFSNSSWSYDMEVMQINVWSDIVSYQTRRLNNSTKYLLLASMTTTLQKKK